MSSRQSKSSSSSSSSSSKPSSSSSKSSSSSSMPSSAHRSHTHSRSKKSSSSSSSALSSTPPDISISSAPFSDDESSTASDHVPEISPRLSRLRRQITPSAPIDIPPRRNFTPPMSFSMTESLAAAKAELDPKNMPPGTANPFIVMPGGDFVPPHILAERARGPPPMARSYPGKRRFKDNGDPPDWFY